MYIMCINIDEVRMGWITLMNEKENKINLKKNILLISKDLKF